MFHNGALIDVIFSFLWNKYLNLDNKANALLGQVQVHCEILLEQKIRVQIVTINVDAFFPNIIQR